MSYLTLTTTQRSPEWRQARCGYLTGSVAGEIVAVGRKKGEEAVGRRDLRLRLALERLTKQPQDDGSGYQSAEMKRGTLKEPDALAAYQAATGELVKACGFLAHPTMLAGCSPDGLIGSVGLVEVKAPKSATHLAYLRAGKLPDDYAEQVAHNLWITGCDWCDFVSFDDRFPRKLQLFVHRVHRNEAAMLAWQLNVTQFLREVAEEYADLARMCMSEVAA